MPNTGGAHEISLPVQLLSGITQGRGRTSSMPCLNIDFNKQSRFEMALINKALFYVEKHCVF